MLFGVVDDQNKWKGKGDQVELFVLILIHIMNDKVSTCFRGIKTHKSVSNYYWQLFQSVFLTSSTFDLL